MHFSITIDHATISSEKALAEFEIIRHIKACFACLGYSEDSFVELLAHYLELEHSMTVLPEKEYHNALEEAREEAYGEGRADREEENREDREEEGGAEPDLYYQGWQDAFNSRVDAQDPIMRKAEYRKGVVDGFNARGAARS